MTYSVLILGLGQIGLSFDLDAEPNTVALTHARAFHEHPNFVLIGGVDKDSGKCELFAKSYAAPAFPDIFSALTSLKPDIVVIATPTATHLKSIEGVLRQHQPRAILCEKPLAFELEDAEVIVKVCQSYSCDLFVNYMRNSEPGALEVKQRLLDGRIKSPVKGVVWYTKGLLNNGSHFLNLLQSWLGEVLDVRLNSPGRCWAGIDPEPDFQVRFSLGDVTFLAAREENFSHYTIELVAANGRLRYEQEGEKIIWQPITSDSIYAGYTVLDSVEYTIKSDLKRSSWHVADHLFASLENRPACISSGDDALRTMQELDRLIKSL